MVSRFDRRALLAGGAAAAAGFAGASALDLGWDGIAGAVTNGPGRNGVSKKTPKKGGSLVFGVDAEESGFLPTTARFDEVGVMYARTVFDPLTIVTAEGGWAPYLAQSVVPNSSYTTWTITLKPNVVFHDGTPCNGAALLQNLQAQSKSLLTGIVINPTLVSITQTGPLAVAISFKSPWVPFPYYLAGGIGGQIAYVVAPSMLANPNGTNHPVGTGPFVFQEWIPNDHFTATANPHYWRPGMPYLDSITFKPIPDEEARAEALKSGTIDLMITDTAQIILEFRGNPSWSYIDDSGKVAGEPDMDCVQLNCLKAPFNNATVRRAAAMAINRQQYTKVVNANVQPISTGLFTPGSPYFSTTQLPGLQPVGGAGAGQAGGEADGRADQLQLGVDQLTVRHPGPGVHPAGVAVRGLQGPEHHRRAERRHQRRAGRPVPGPGLAAVRSRGPGPELHLLELHHGGWRGEPLHQHGPQRGPEDRGRPADRPRQHRSRRAGHRLPDGQQAPGPGPALPVAGPGDLGRDRQSQRAELQ